MPPTASIDPATLREVQARLLAWYSAEGRDLPWRHTRDPYAVLVSEVMLQQTQVERVIPKWRAWLDRFPTLGALAEASRGDVIRAWQGLGYNLRAVRLHEVARAAVAEYGGLLPSSLAGLLGLRGIGRYTAGAVACFAYGEPVSMVDTNVRRVLGRVFLGLPRVEPGSAGVVQAIADEAVQALVTAPPAGASEPVYAWNQALMDLGASLCRAARPACLLCPLLGVCRAGGGLDAWRVERARPARAASPASGRAVAEPAARYLANGAATRRLRGRVVDAVRALGPDASLRVADLAADLAREVEAAGGEARLPTVLADLASDGLIAVEGDPAAPDTARLRLPD